MNEQTKLTNSLIDEVNKMSYYMSALKAAIVDAAKLSRRLEADSVTQLTAKTVILNRFQTHFEKHLNEFRDLAVKASLKNDEVEEN